MVQINKNYLSMKDITKLKVKDRVFYRVIHHLAGMITEVTVFQLEKDNKNKEVMLTEITIQDVSEEEQREIMSDRNAVKVNEYDKELVVQALQEKLKLLKSIAAEKLNAGIKRRLINFYEVGGQYFGFVYEQGMPYPKFYHLIIDAVKRDVYVKGVPPEMLPALFEAISPVVINNQSWFTVQVDDGVYARLSVGDPETAVVTVVVAIDDESETKLQTTMGFTLKKIDEQNWFATVIDETEQSKIKKEMEDSFNTLYQELLVKVFEIKGDEALKVM